MNIIKRLLVWLKGLPIGLTGLVAFIGIMLLLTTIFNWFWTGLGTDPTRTFYAPFTNNFSDFKEYAALYIPLISFGATLFAGFVVFLAFNDWKEQHNKTVITEDAKKIFKLIHGERNYIHQLRFGIDYELLIPNNRFDVTDERQQDNHNKLLTEFNQNTGEISEFVNLVEGQKLYNIIKNYRKEFESFNRLNTKYIEDLKSYREVEKQYRKELEKTEVANNLVLSELKKYIFIK